MKQALGLVEISGLSTAVVVADTMAKAANVQILEVENSKGLGYMAIKIVGDVGAVKAAVDAGRQIGSSYGKLVSWKVIPRPSDYVERVFCKTAPETPPEPPQAPEPPPEAPEPPAPQPPDPPLLPNPAAEPEPEQAETEQVPFADEERAEEAPGDAGQKAQEKAAKAAPAGKPRRKR